MSPNNSVELNKRRRLNVLGVDLTPTDYNGACEAIIAAAEAKRALTVTALAVHGVMTGVLNKEHCLRLNALDLVLPDGQPVRWALNMLFGVGLRDRVYGPTLMLRICERAEALGLSVGLYGNRQEVLNELRLALVARYPRLSIATPIPSRFGRVSRAEQVDLAQHIADSGVDLLFVGLGCPRQEVWLYENRLLLDLPLIAVGAAFDFHADRIPQAPCWMQARGLEWIFRFYHEPRRLWRRYVLLNPLFLGLLALQILGARWTLKLERPETISYEGYA